MFRTKKDVDRHVQDVMRKLKNENERNLRCYNIAKLYFMVGEYELARRYVSSYLSVREDSASAHKLLGQALENLGQKEKALAQYKCSLELESKQQDLVLKVCELMVDSEASLDVGRARYWCQRAEQLFPHHPTVFRLKEHLLTADGEEDAAELEALIASELTARPTDVSLRVRLLRLYLDTERLTDAYNHAIEVENCVVPGFRDQLSWYDCLIDVFETYQEENHDKCDWEFHLHYVSVLERAACLTLQENHAGGCRGIADSVHALFSFDKALHQASNQTAPPSERELFKEFLKHARGQLCLHLATLVLKKAKKERGNWREACRVSSPLLLLALSAPVDLQSTWLLQATETRKKTVDLWAKEAAYRNSQAGHVLLSMVHERKSQFLDRVTQFCSGNWRERVFQRIFTTRDHQQGMANSHFVNFQGFAEPPLRLPTASELLPHDEKSQKLYPGSLHHLVWLGLQDVSNSNKKYTSLKPGPDFRCQVFEGLQLTCNNLNNAGAETLSRLDIDAFLYAAVFCAGAAQEEQQAAGYWSSDRPRTLPANIVDQLCTINQANWWTAAYRVYTNQAKGDLGELRQTLQRGIEVVRVLGNHGLDVKLIVQLARAFAERASALAAQTEGSNELPAVEVRASLYWTSALPLLERLQRNQAIRAPHTRLFEYQGKELSTAEVNALIEEGRFFLACQLMKEDKHEKAIEAFQQLKSPYASFYQATIYKKLAAEELEDQRREMITSEMRSKHIILLTKARECYYLTLDRLRSPGVDAKHPLNAELNSHIEEIESQLSRIDPDVMLVGGDVNRNECDGMSDGSVSSAPSGGDNLNNSLTGLGNSSSLYLQHNSLLHLTPRHRGSGGGHKQSSTPFRSNILKVDNSDIAAEHPRRTEARPSPERLDAQIRHLVHSKDTIMQTLVEQNKALLEQSKAMVEGLRENKLVMEEIRNQIQELRKDTAKMRRQGLSLGQSNVNTDLSQVCDPEEDLYVFDDEDYSEDVNLTAAQLGQYQAFPPYPNYTNYRGISSILGTPSGVGPYPAPHSGTQTPLLPPQPPPPIGGFFRGVDPSAASLMYPATLGYYAGQGALPFSEGQQLPNFGSAGPGIPTQAATASIFSRLGGSADSPGSLHDPKVAAPAIMAQQLPPPPQPAQHPQSVGPVNVVITSSDTLPTSVPVNQPTLSVTIPPQHRLGTPLIAQPSAALSHHSTTSAFTSTTILSTTSTTTTSTATPSSVPHAFQISMPPQAQLPHASILEKGAATLSPVLPISTGMLLSSVPSPVYSAVDKKSPSGKENVPVGDNVSSTGDAPRRISTGSAIEGDDDKADGDDTEHDPCPDFQPVIPLPAEVELTTGEEEEIVLFESRAKLFRYAEKEWKERGVGVMKLLHNKKTGKVRALMRREQVLKICANHFLRPDMELTKMNDRAWMWVAHDYADEKMQLEKLSIRFKTTDEAINFKEAFDKAKSIVALSETSPVKQDTGNIRPAPVINETVKVTPATATSKITVGGFTFASPPTFKVDIKSSAAQSSSNDVTKDREKGAGESVKPSPFAGFSFTSPPKTSASADSVVVTSSGPDAVPLRRPHTIPKSVVSSPATVSTPQKSETTQNASKSSELMFDSPNPNLTFSTLASKKETGFKSDKNFKGWEGAGKSVFGGSGHSEQLDENENEGTVEDFEPTAEFKPVIPLPELVELKTGEEDESILFEERAKLLRFDSEGKQWKERGIGKLKVMQHPTTGKVRLLMRREQVLKVCCNHFVTKDMKFSMLSTSDRAWSWFAQDYSEGEMKPELFAVKFKTVEQAHSFQQVIIDVQQKMNEKGSLIMEQTKSSQTSVWKCEECIFPNASDTNSCISCKKSRPRQLKESPVFVSRGSDQQPKLMEISKSADSWVCHSCNFKNADKESCGGCGKPKISKVTLTVSSSSSETKPLSDMFKPKSGSWECKICLVRNEGTSDVCVACGTPSEAKPLSDMFKPKSGSWECKTCLVRNEGTSDVCVACETPKPGSKGTSKVTTPTVNFCFGIPKSTTKDVPLSELFKPKQGSWECNSCYTRNDADKFACVSCTTPKPGFEGKQKEKSDVGTSKTTFQFGIPATASGFNIGTSQSTPSQSEFTFGINTNTNSAASDGVKFNFGIPTSTVTVTSSSAPSLFTVSNSTKSSFTFNSPAATTSVSTSTIFSDGKSTNKPFSFEPKSSGAFLFGSALSSVPASNTSSLTFSFGSTTSQSDATSTKDKSEHKFTFGSPGKFEFSFSGVRPKSPVKSPKSPGVSAHAADDDESGSEAEEDEGEHIYFQPVIPLPDKVPLHTGEEEEDILYCHRAKLFRFTGGEWKERGVGDIKLLKHHNTHKIRLLMRREQVLKLCLNHFLNSELQFREKDEKTWLWSAQDFSEGHLQEEKFAIRFKNKEIATEFKNAIDKAQAEIKHSTPGPATVKSASIKQESTAAVEKGAGDGSIVDTTSAMKNFSFALSSASSETLQNTSPVFSLASRFGGSSSGGCAKSLFGGSPLQKSFPVMDLTNEKDEVEVVYELKVTPEEEAAAAKLKLPLNFYSYLRKSPCPGCAGCEPENSSDTEDILKGQHTSKPPVFVKQHTPTTTASNTVTTQSNQKHVPVTSVQASVTSTKSISSTSESPLRQFSSIAISSGTPSDQGVLSPQAFNLQTSSASSTTTPSQPQSSVFGQSKRGPLIATPKLGTNTNLTSIFSQPQSSVSNLQEGTPVFGEGSVTSTNGSFFGQPSTQQSTPFSNVGSTSKSALNSGFQALVSQPSQTAVTTSESSKPTFVFSVGPKPQAQTDSDAPKPLNFSFGNTLAVKPPATSTPEVASASGFSFSSSAPSSSIKPASFNFGVTSSEPAESAKSGQSQVEEGVPFLPFDSSLSFANLATKADQEFKTDKKKDFSWDGAGATVFGQSSKQHSSKDGQDSSGDEGGTEDTVNSSYDPHFEPIIALPEAIEVRTGEEDETRVFCSRARLFRYEASTKEWKERGVGEMKILHHPVNRTYRLLLRREQVHKVVCNQLITPDLVLNPLSTSDRAWCWGGLNYAEEDEPKVEELAVRFKLSEIAEEFRDKVYECISQITAAAPPTVTAPEEISMPEVTVVDRAESEDTQDDSDEDDDDEDEDDEDDEESEKTLMFEKRTTLLIQDPVTSEWASQGPGDLQIVYDNDIYGARITVEQDGSGAQICNTVIALNTTLEVKKRDCIWSGLDYSEDPPVQRTFKAKFSSEEAALEFHKTFEEGKELAEQSEIVEHVNPAELSPDED